MPQGRSSEHFVVVGGSIAGLASTLALARAGFEVTMVERDGLPIASDPEEAFALERPGTPQVLAVHVFLARIVEILRTRFPDVLNTLSDVGVPVESAVDFADLTNEVGVLRARRSTIEWVLLKTIANEPNVTIETGRAVRELQGTTGADGRPHVTGAILDDGAVISGTVVACTGRRGDVDAWLQPFGVRIEEHVVESERVYSSRWYSVDDASDRSTILRDLDFLTFLAMPADAGTLSVGISVHPSDKELRNCIYDDDAFDRVARQLPTVGAWLEAAGATPIRSVRPMAGLVNRLRTYVGDDGDPLVLGFHAVGDAHTLTNPVYGRGCSLAFVQATLLADAAVANPDDPFARAKAYESASVQQVEPWYHNSVEMDRTRIESAERPSSDVPPLSELMPVLMEGSGDAPAVTFGLIRMMNLLVTPNELFSDPDFGAGVATLLANLPDTPRESTGPSRADILAAAGLQPSP